MARRVPVTASAGWSAMARAAHSARSRELVAGDHLGDEADLVGPLGGHPLVGTEQRESHHLLEGHLVQEEDRLEGGRHAVGDVRVEEGGVVGGDDEVHLAEDVEGPAAGHPVDRGDDRLPEVVRLRADALARVVEVPGRVVAGELPGRQVLDRADALAVEPGRECLVARAGEHDAADVVVGAEPEPQLAQLPLHGGVEGVRAPRGG